MLIKGSIDAAQYSFQRNAGTLPSFDQRPIERRQINAPTPSLKMLFDFGEVIEVVFHDGLAETWFAHSRNLGCGRHRVTSGLRAQVALPDNPQPFQRQELI